MNECEHVIVLDVCCTIERPTTMCLAKTTTTKQQQKTLHGLCFCCPSVDVSPCRRLPLRGACVLK